MYKTKNAILFITFVKFDTAFKVFESIIRAEPARLYISSDGGRNPQEHQKINEFRKCLLQRITWKCKIFTLFHDTNNGCKMGPYNAISWFFENEEQGIVLEDDCLPDPTFYRFCDELLEKYKKQEKIAMIGGWSPLEFDKNLKNQLKEDYFFSKYNHIWGWASWKRSWKQYDINQKDLMNIKTLAFDSLEEKRYWKRVAKICLKQKVEAWDYPWLFHILKKQQLCIVPKHNMIRNIGFNRFDATHTNKESKFENMKLFSQSFPLLHPKTIERNIILDKGEFLIIFKPPHLLIRIKNKVKLFIKDFLKTLIRRYKIKR